MENLDHINQKDDEMRHILQGPLDGNDAWAQPGERVWEGIAASLPPKKKRGGFWWWFGGLIAVILLLVFSQQKGSSPDVVLDANSSRAVHESSSSTPQKSSQSSELLDRDKSISSPEEPAQAGIDMDPELVPSAHGSRLITHQHDDIKAELVLPASVPPSDKEVPSTESEKEFISPFMENLMEEEPRADYTAPKVHEDIYVFPELALPLNGIHSESVVDISALNQPMLNYQPPVAIQKSPSTSVHRLLVYGQGFGADRQIKRKTNINLFDPEFGHQNWQYRLGAGYEWQHKSRFFVGSGLEYQDFHERVDKEKKWTFTKKNATQVGTDTYQQNIPVVINTGFGTTTTTLRVDIEESSVATDYQEGDNVSFRMTVDHSLKWLRVPVYAGYHYEWKNWFAEVRGGMGLQIFLASNSTITEILEARNKIKIRESESTKQLNHVRKTIWDAQGGLYAGYSFSDNWSASIGYEQWYSLQSVVDRPNVSTITTGSGIQLALRRTF
ncbi:MAG: porin family protein [Saprospiraceae bacterium]|nr:porin family protein [Saprospiraceae bacterium]